MAYSMPSQVCPNLNNIVTCNNISVTRLYTQRIAQDISQEPN